MAASAEAMRLSMTDEECTARRASGVSDAGERDKNKDNAVRCYRSTAGRRVVLMRAKCALSVNMLRDLPDGCSLVVSLTVGFGARGWVPAMGEGA